MALVLGFGPGLFLLGLLWILSLIIYLITIRASGSARHLGTGAIISCSALSLLLFCIPREPKTPIQVDVLQYNYMDLYRLLLIIFCALSVILGCLFYCATQLMEPIYTMTYRKINTIRSSR